MATTGAAADGLLLRGVYEGCISASHTDVSRRPYHKNCGCALHGQRRHRCPHAPPQISYGMRRSWSEGSLALYAAATSVNSSPASSPAPVDVVMPKGTNHYTHLEICNEDVDDVFFK